jgi:hypothetical protein
MNIESKIKKLLNKLEQAARAHEWEGSQPTADRDSIRKHYYQTRGRVEKTLAEMCRLYQP